MNDARSRSRIAGRRGSAVNDSSKKHWDSVYGRRTLTDVSWYEALPDKSLALIRASGVQIHDSIIDVGGGAAFLVDALLDLGYRDLTVLDISSDVLAKLRERLGPRAGKVTILQDDVTNFHPVRRFALWHDRAMFHFLVRAEDRAAYFKVLRAALRPDGQVIIATFGPAGPERCSGLPVMRYDAAALARQFGEDFRLIESSLAVHHTPTGASQQFLYCRFQRIQSGGAPP
jgi:SAM-dependent methyltransferase